MADNLNNVLRACTIAGTKLIPEVGSAISLLVSGLWPVTSDSDPFVWRDIESRVKKLCGNLINENNAREMRDAVQGLYNVLKLYQQQTPGTPQKGQYFTNLMSLLAEKEPMFFDQNAPWLTLPYFSSAGTLYLTVLREQCLFYKDIYGTDDPNNAERRRQDLEAKVNQYMKARDTAIDKCVQWHKDQITFDFRDRDSGYWNKNDVRIRDPVRGVDETIKWDDSNKAGKWMFEAKKQQLLDWCHTGYRAELESTLAPTYAWPLFNPKNTEPTVSRLMMHYPDWIGAGYFWTWKYFDDKEFYLKNGPITQINFHGGDRLDGIEVFYGDKSSGLRGQRGGEAATLYVGDNDIVGRIAAGAPKNVADKDDPTGYIQWLSMETLHKPNKYRPRMSNGRGSLAKIPCGYTNGNQYYYNAQWHQKNLDKPKLLWLSGWAAADGPSGYVLRLLPAFGYTETWSLMQQPRAKYVRDLATLQYDSQASDDSD